MFNFPPLFTQRERADCLQIVGEIYYYSPDQTHSTLTQEAGKERWYEHHCLTVWHVLHQFYGAIPFFNHGAVPKRAAPASPVDILMTTELSMTE